MKGEGRFLPLSPLTPRPSPGGDTVAQGNAACVDEASPAPLGSERVFGIEFSGLAGQALSGDSGRGPA